MDKKSYGYTLFDKPRGNDERDKRSIIAPKKQEERVNVDERVEEKGENIEMENITDFDIPEIDEEAIKQAKEEGEGVKDESGGAITYAFIGSGQGGSRIAEAFYNFGYKKTLILNTAEHDLSAIKVPDEQKLLMKLDLSGAGKDMVKGAAAAKKYEESIYSLMKKVFGPCDRILVCVGAGGGTGGGSVFTILDLARKYLNSISVEDPGKKIGVVCSLPENGECSSPIVAENAINVVNQLCEFAEGGQISPLVLIDNGKIRKLFPKLTMNQYWANINKTIAGMFNVFNVMATKNSEYASFDPADYNSIMSTGGCLIMGATKVKDFSDKQSISASIKSNLERTLLAEGFDLTTAKAAGSIVVGGDILFNTIQGLPESINDGFDTIAILTGNAIVHRGIYSEPGDKITIYNIITGLSSPVKRIDELARFLKGKKNSIYEDNK